MTSTVEQRLKQHGHDVPVAPEAIGFYVPVLRTGNLVITSGQLPVIGHDSLSPVYSAHGIIQTARPQLSADAPFYMVNTFDHTVPFYLGRTVTMVRYTDELEKAISWETHKFIPDLDGFARAWSAEGPAFAMFNPPDLMQFRRTHPAVPMIEIARDPRRVIVKKP